MAGEARVGSAYIEISPKLSAPATARTKKELKAALEGMGKAASKSLTDSQKDLMSGFQKEMKLLQKGKTKEVFAQHREEMKSWQSLQKQREAAIKATDAQQMKAFNAEKKRIADSLSAQKSLAAQRDAALSEERKRIESIQRAEVQAYAEDSRRTKALEDQRKRALAERQKQIEMIARAERQAHAENEKRFLQEERYRAMRAAGFSPAESASVATGKKVNPGDFKGSLVGLGEDGRRAGFEVSKALDRASHSMSQLSTRIGLGSFQLQLLGGFATTFFTGPAAMGFGMVARDGLKFATSIDYARASMKALLGPAVDVEKIISDIKTIAIESPLFNTEDAISYAQKLASVGVKAEDLYPSMQALSNIFMTQGVAGPERASLALMAYTQILSKGAIGMDDLRQQFAEHVPGGIKIFEQVAKRMGYDTLEDLRKAFKAGAVTAEELNQEFIKLGNSEKYLQGAAEGAKTLGGTWQAFVEEFQAAIGTGFDKNRKEIIRAIDTIRPVVMRMAEGFAKSLPTIIYWLGKLAVKAQEIKDAYDNLSPAQQRLVREVFLIALAAGPTAIALGILGTALSGVANFASLALKSLSLFGAALPAGGAFTGILLGIGAIVSLLAVLYTRSESVRKGVQQAFNIIKDVIADVLLPVVDRLVGSLYSLEETFGFLGFEVKHLAYVLLILAAPIALLALAIAPVIAAMKALQLTMVALSATAYGFLMTIELILAGIQKIAEGLDAIGMGGDLIKPEAIEGWRNSLKGLADDIDVAKQWTAFTSTGSSATKDLQTQLNDMDFTVTGLSGAFGQWNGIVDTAIQKQLTLEDAVNNARKAMQSQGSTAVSLTDASDGYKQAVLNLKDAIKLNGQTLNENTREGQNNRTMLKQATQASFEMMLQDIRSGVPMNEAIERHKKRTKALQDEFGKNKETRAEAQKLIETYGKVPENVATLLRMMGYTDVAKKMQEILAAQKVAANPGMSYSKALHAERKAWELEKKEGLKGYATGGLIRGPGGPTGDKIPIMASDLEYMIRARSAQKLGKPVLDYINRTGELPVQEFAKGGQVTWPLSFDMSKTRFPEMLGGSPGGGGMGWQRMMAVLRKAFPGLPMYSGFRPGAVTSTGNRSYHAMGRAVDLPPRWDVFKWISQNYGKSTRELIYTPAGGRQIKNGQFHRFSGGTIERDHYDHVHWAYDNGGLIKPNQPFINKTGANELALNSAQGAALERKIANSDRPVNVTVYVDGVRRDAETVVDEKFEELIQQLGGV